MRARLFALLVVAAAFVVAYAALLHALIDPITKALAA